jgi:DNA-binding MarR family transcriptional regulator
MDLGEPRWLTPEEQRAWRALASVLFKLPGALESQLQRDAGLSHFEYLVLSALSEAEDRTLRMKDLAALSNGSLSRLSHVVTRLEKRGWVRRTPDPTDGRCTLAILTGDGWEKFVGSFEAHSEEIRRLVFDPLTKAQTRQLREIGHRILQTIDPSKQDRPPGFKAEISGFCPNAC